MFTFDDSVLWRCCDYVLDAGVGVDDCSSFPVFEDDIDNNNRLVRVGGGRDGRRGKVFLDEWKVLRI